MEPVQGSSPEVTGVPGWRRRRDPGLSDKTPFAFRYSGLLLGGAVGDALGLPAEGISRTRQLRMWPGHLRHRFFLGQGMISDDTEHAFMTGQALLEAQGDVERFRRALAWKLRWWFVALPAGVGLATARACIRLWLGVPPERSGVQSAGNGPAMRSAIIGAVFADAPV
jgi:ADP-ribosyl-[dinitrogen reductase] hydrolase